MTKIFYLMEKDVNPCINVIKVIVVVIGYEEVSLCKGGFPNLIRLKTFQCKENGRGFCCKAVWLKWTQFHWEWLDNIWGFWKIQLEDDGSLEVEVFWLFFYRGCFFINMVRDAEKVFHWIFLDCRSLNMWFKTSANSFKNKSHYSAPSHIHSKL